MDATRSSAAPVLRILLVLLISCLCIAKAVSAPLAPADRAEIDALLARLEASGCEFHRNGTWHSAAEARSHLLRKLKYLEDRGAVRNAEQFIELAASNSSVSGRPYLVRCGSEAPARSADWLRSQLRAMRSDGKSGSAP